VGKWKEGTRNYGTGELVPEAGRREIGEKAREEPRNGGEPNTRWGGGAAGEFGYVG